MNSLNIESGFHQQCNQQSVEAPGHGTLENLDGHTGLSEYEVVNHPKHYNMHPKNIECIDVIEEMPFNIGTAIKYLWRVGLKPGTSVDKELDKAIWCINREKKRLSK